MPGHILNSLWNMQWKRSKGYGDDTIEIDNSIKEWVEGEELDWAKLKEHYWADEAYSIITIISKGLCQIEWVGGLTAMALKYRSLKAARIHNLSDSVVDVLSE